MHVLTARLFDTIVEPDASSILHVFLLSVLCGVLYFPYLGSTAFFDKGEPREALAVQDIVQRGEWLFPLKRATDIPSKPPLFHWSAASVSKVMGRLDEFTIRFPSALYATLGVLLVYVFARKLFGAQVGLLGGAILGTSLVYSSQAITARVDMTLCFFVTLSLVIFYSLYRRIPDRPALVLCFLSNSWHRRSGKRAAGYIATCACHRFFYSAQEKMGPVFQVLLSSRADFDVARRCRLVRNRAYPGRRRIYGSPTPPGKYRAILRRFGP